MTDRFSVNAHHDHDRDSEEDEDIMEVGSFMGHQTIKIPIIQIVHGRYGKHHPKTRFLFYAPVCFNVLGFEESLQIDDFYLGFSNCTDLLRACKRLFRKHIFNQRERASVGHISVNILEDSGASVSVTKQVLDSKHQSSSIRVKPNEDNFSDFVLWKVLPIFGQMQKLTRMPPWLVHLHVSVLATPDGQTYYHQNLRSRYHAFSNVDESILPR